MKRGRPLWCFFVLAALSATAQPGPDSTALLDTVTVQAFSAQTRWKEVPAAVALLNQQALNRFGNASLVPVFNTLTGIRMEERSPGSYRLSIRGSLLRSPFGIRNIKVYWGDIPLTDAGGNTYLNLVDIQQLRSVEVVKGPASSLYGANTGGAVLLHSGADTLHYGSSWQAGTEAGLYGLFRQQLAYQYQGARLQLQVKQQHLQSDGYRRQSALRRDGGQLNGNWQLNTAQDLSFLFFYTSLHYQTPGGITLAQMIQDPRQARPPGNGLPGAVEQQAAVFNQTSLGGITLRSKWGSHWTNMTTLTANHTGFRNPFITNYEQRNEWNYAGRTSFRYQWKGAGIRWQALAGGEWQHNQARVTDYGNRGGQKDTLQFRDRLFATQAFLFAQLQAAVGKRWHLQAGVSRNTTGYAYQRTAGVPLAGKQRKNTGALWAPRFSLLYSIHNSIGVYGIVAKGFSPPGIAEVRPSDGNYYGNLQPECGWNYEAGIKGVAWNGRLEYDGALYYFRLTHAIVRRVNDAGAEYFVNAGGTRQKGMELFARGWVLRQPARWISGLSLFNSYSYQPYRFTTYVSGTSDYSGNRLTGVPRTVNVSGLDLFTRPGWYASVTINYTASLPLTDANDAFAASYRLLQARIGYHPAGKSGFSWNAYVGGDNLLNQAYSLGNDLNALGKRYYNPAPGRTVYAGIQLGW